jgi:hypothetical protein
MHKQIKIRIFPDGHIQAEIEGIKGKKCTDYINIIEEILQAEVIDSDYTPEYYDSEVVSDIKERKEIEKSIHNNKNW